MYAAAVSAWRIRRDDAVAGRPAGVDPIREFCLLEDSQVHVGLGHPPECHIQPPLLAVTDVVGAESVTDMLRQASIKTENHLMDFSDSSWQDFPDTGRSTGAYHAYAKIGRA